MGRFAVIPSWQLTGALWQATLDSLSDHVAVLDGDGSIIAVNAAWRRFAEHERSDYEYVGADYIGGCRQAPDPLGHEIAEALGAIAAGEREVFELEFPRRSQSVQRWFRLRASRFAGPGPGRVVVLHVDITEQRRAREEERALLSARNYLRAATDSVAAGIFTFDREGRVVYMNQEAEDLLGWSLPELEGHVMHPIVHSQTADGSPLAIENCPIVRAGRDGDIVRGEDEVFRRRDGSQFPVAFAAAPFATDDGIPGSVVVFADISERKAAADGVMADLEKLSGLQRLKDALFEDRLVLYTQPIIDLQTSEVVQHELLIRMLGTECGADGSPIVVAPGEFLPVAEEYGLITEIDRWVIDRGAEIAAAGEAVQINVSALSVADPSVPDHIQGAINRTGADPATIVFEITETTLISDEAAAHAFVERLHDLGCKVALDDFGTGYGGFTYLKQLPIDGLKIDIEFVRDLRDSSASRSVVRAIVELARGFSLQTVAEGVEDRDALQLLSELGVDCAQGFYIHRPSAIESRRVS